MGKGDCPATCAVTGKRLRAKSWYYRNGNYFYNKRVWREEQAKRTSEAAKATAGSKPQAAAPAEPGAAAPQAQPDASPPSS